MSGLKGLATVLLQRSTAAGRWRPVSQIAAALQRDAATGGVAGVSGLGNVAADCAAPVARLQHPLLAAAAPSFAASPCYSTSTDQSGTSYISTTCTTTTTSYASSSTQQRNNADPAKEVVDSVLGCLANGIRSPDVLSKLATSAIDHAPKLTAPDIMALTTSFAKLGYFNTDFKSSMADAIIRKMNDFEPAVLAETAWAFGEMQYLDYDLMTQMMPYLASRAKDFDASSMAKVLWSCGRLGYTHQSLVDMMQHVTDKLREGLNPEAAAEVIFAAGQVGWGEGQLAATVADYAQDNINAFPPHALGKLAYGLTCLGYDDADLYQSIFHRATELVESLSPQDVSRIMWVAGEQGLYYRPWLEAVADVAIPSHADAFTAEQLTSIIEAFNKLGYSSPHVGEVADLLSTNLGYTDASYPAQRAAVAQGMA